MRQMPCAPPARECWRNWMLARNVLTGRDVLCEFPHRRASIPFWHLSSSLLRKPLEVLSAAPDCAMNSLMRVFGLSEASSGHKAIVELVIMVQNGWLLNAKEIHFTAAQSPQPGYNQDTLALLRLSSSAGSSSHLMDKRRRMIMR
jgi:hypothetical protein